MRMRTCSRRQFLALAACSLLAPRVLAHDAAHPHEPDAEEIALGSLADAELAFAKAVEDRGRAVAFRQFARSDAVLLEDRGKQERADDHPSLRYELHLAQVAVSRAHDLGYATGSYVATATESAQRQGVYLSAWVRERGTWRIVLASFVTTPSAVDFVTLGAAPRSSFGGRGTEAAERTKLLALESRPGEPARAASGTGSDVRVYREGSMPQVARGSKPSSEAQATPTVAVVSRSADMAVTYAPPGASARGWHVHVWLRDRHGNWRIAYDVTGSGAE